MSPYPTPRNTSRRPRRVRSVIRFAAAVALVAGLSACNNTRVARVDPTSVTDLSGKWNDADSRLVASALIGQSLDADWATQWAKSHGGRTPAVIIGSFANRTYGTHPRHDTHS